MNIRIKLLVTCLAGAIIFVAGAMIPREELSWLHFALMAIGVITVLTFYFATFRDMLRTLPENSSKRIFWTIVLVSLPVIGEIIYLIAMNTTYREQHPEKAIV